MAGRLAGAEDGVSAVRENRLITVRAPSAGDFRRYCYDMACGGNLIAYQVEGPMTSISAEWAYEQQGAVWVPVSFSYTNTEKPPGRQRSIRRTVRFFGNRVNGPVDAAEFAVEGLGLLPGTKVTDWRNGLLYRFGSGEPPKTIPVRETAAEPRHDFGEPSAEFPFQEFDLAEAAPAEVPEPVPVALRSAAAETARVPDDSQPPGPGAKPGLGAETTARPGYEWFVGAGLLAAGVIAGVVLIRRRNRT